jgi:5-methylcytosine-specific restriction protein A
MARKSLGTRERARLFLLHDGLCHICSVRIDGTRERWEVEHVIPWAISRDDSDENRKPAHVHCHAVKTKDDRKDISKTERMRLKANGSWRSRTPMRRPQQGSSR